MMKPTLNWQAVLAAILVALSLAWLPLNPAPAGAMTWAIYLLVGFAVLVSVLGGISRPATVLLGLSTHLAVILLLGLLPDKGALADGQRYPLSYFALIAASWLMAWRLVTILSGDGSRGAGEGLLGRVGVPALFGIWILVIWEVSTRAGNIPFVILPPPSAVWDRILISLPILGADFAQTVLKAVLFGFVVGSGAGFIVAVAADRYRFLSNGLLPIGNLVSALPIIGVAPIMVIWFGFDWQSKAAVVIVMTFFPMLVNTIEGLKSAGHMERDLMRTYGASHWQTLLKLRLPAAMPFVFNALKINSTLALIGALVSEFFGTPVVGMGFRISTEVGRMNLDMVWAEIALAAVVGSLFYGALALLERAMTFWHSSYRS
jgi:NitT/TauT family transport system permease protein